MSLESIFKLSLIMNMVDNLTGPVGRVSNVVGGSISKLDGMSQAMAGMAKGGAVMAGVGAEITSAVLAPVEATFATRRAIGELSSLGVQDLKTVEDAARRFSDTWAGTTKSDFISAAYDIKSGIASLGDEGVAQFTELAGLTAKATKSTVAEMTSLFATGYGIYKGAYADISDLKFGEMFSGGISTSVKQFKTTGSGMAQAIQSLGASATTASVPLEEQLTILGMLQATMSGGEAGTKYKAFLRSAVRGGEELGLSFMDANNQLLSLPEILDKLRGKFGETMDAAEKLELQKAFGDAEAVSLIDLMYSKTGDLQSNVLGMYDALGSGLTATQQMAEAMNNMEPDRIDVLTQNLHNVAEIAGNTLLPTIVDLTSRASAAAQSFGAWAEDNQETVRVIMTLLLALGGFLAIAGATIAVTSTVGLIFTKTAGAVMGLKTGLTVLKDGFDTVRLYGMFAADGIKKGFSVMRTAGTGAIGSIKNVALSMASMAKTAIVSGVSALKSMALGMVGMAKQAIITAATALPGLIAGVWSFTAALLANPITWIVIGIMALIAALILLWQNWDAVTTFLKGAWTSFCNLFSTATNAIKGAFNGVIEWIQGKIAWFGECGKKIIDTLVGGIKAVAMKPVEAITGIFQKVRNLLPFSDAKEGPLSELTLSGKRVMTTFAGGVTSAQEAPEDSVAKSLAGVRSILDQPLKPLRVRTEREPSEAGGGSGSKSGGIVIQKLVISPDISKIKDLPMLLNLVKELMDVVQSNSGGDEPSPESA